MSNMLVEDMDAEYGCGRVWGCNVYVIVQNTHVFLGTALACINVC